MRAVQRIMALALVLAGLGAPTLLAQPGAPPASWPSTYPLGWPHWPTAFSITAASPRDTVPKNL